VPVGGTLLALTAWELVAHNSGSGWVQAVGAIVGGGLLVGLLAPAAAVHRVRVTVLESPVDATAGQAAVLSVVATRPVRVRPLDPPGAPTSATPVRRTAVALVPERRGELSSCVLDVASAAPFGMLWWHEHVTVPLPRPLLVAPRVGEPDDGTISEGERAHAGRPAPARVGEPRGVRPYRRGDLRHWVHWPATAHTGSLMVREMESPAGPPVTVRAALPPDPDGAERAAERALGTVARLLAEGREVLLVTTEPGGERAERVQGLLAAGRRLARAVPAWAADTLGEAP